MPLPLALIPAAFQGIVGIKQLLEGKDTLAGITRPTYEIPDEIKQATGIAKANYADKRFEGQSNLERQVALNEANALSAATQRGGGMAQVGAIQAQSNQAAQQISAEQARQNRADQAEYSNMQQILAKYRDMEFQMNKMAPYSDKYNEGRERIGAGQQNIFGSLDAAATIGTRLLSASQGQSAAGGVPVSQVAPVSIQQQSNSEYSDTMLARFMQQMASNTQSDPRFKSLMGISKYL